MSDVVTCDVQVFARDGFGWAILVPIWSVLGPFLADKSGDALELGSGTGQHVVDFAGRAPGIRWQPSDLAAEHLRSIEGWRRTSGRRRWRQPITAP